MPWLRCAATRGEAVYKPVRLGAPVESYAHVTVASPGASFVFCSGALAFDKAFASLR
jgi:hypothetical protein